jgi:predicted KAP-like P-loop ATPase
MMHNLLIAGPERPIRTKSEDLLDRGRFVRRLCDAIINRQTRLATGVTLGVTGEWGSGKSSILHLLHECIDEQYSNAIVIRFDPWLISGRDDLIRHFFLDFQASIKEKPGLREKLPDLVDKIAEYSAYLAPLVNLNLPGAGDALSGGVNAVSRAISRETTLHAQREELLRTLGDASAPIVVLIDELDRVEDVEIRAIAQLVGAIADFPSISYVLAYDHNRVIQALGAGENGIQRSERGRAYLEKIVQFQIALPVTLDGELKALLEAELKNLATDVALPDGWQNMKRFQLLLNTMIPHPITTPRDIKRLLGTYHVIRSMLKGEVEWVDLLAFSALLVKAPAIVAKLRQQPDSVVTNPLSEQVSFERYSQVESKPEDRLAQFLPEEEAASGVAALLSFLFPLFATG